MGFKCVTCKRVQVVKCFSLCLAIPVQNTFLSQQHHTFLLLVFSSIMVLPSMLQKVGTPFSVGWVTGDNLTSFSPIAAMYIFSHECQHETQSKIKQRLIMHPSKSNNGNILLGRWHDNGPIHQRWTYFVDLFSQCLLHIPEGKSMLRCYLPAHSSQVFHHKGTVTFSHPVTILPVTVAHQNDSLITITAHPPHSHGYTHPLDCTPLMHRSTMSSLPHHLDTLTQALWSAMGHCFFPTNISNLVTEYNNHTLVISSDRSVTNNVA